MASGIINSLGSVAQGVLQGHALANQIRQAADEHELVLRQQFQQDRNNRLQDEQLRRQGQNEDNDWLTKMQEAGAKPVEGGTVSDTFQPPQIPGMIGTLPAADVLRKPDASRTVKRTTYDGQTLERELLTPNDQFEKRMREAGLMGDVAAANAAKKVKSEQEATQVDLPEYGKVPKATIPFYTSAEDNKARAAAAESKPDKPDPSTVIHDSRPLTDDQGNTKQVITFQDGHVVTKPLDAKGKTKTLAASTPGTPEDNKTVAQAIADYKMPAPTLSRSPANRALMAQVLQLNPEYNGTFFPTSQKTETAFTSGREAKNVNAAGTALGHLGVLSDASDALKNGNVKILNDIANRFGVAVGKDPVTTFKTIVHRVGPELVSAYVGAGGGQGERELAEKDFDPSASPEQLKSNIGISAQLLKSKVGALQQQYKQGTQGRGKLQLLSPESQATLDRLGSGGGSGKGKIAVVSPEGVPGLMDADKWAAAEKRGFKRQ